LLHGYYNSKRPPLDPSVLSAEEESQERKERFDEEWAAFCADVRRVFENAIKYWGYGVITEEGEMYGSKAQLLLNDFSLFEFEFKKYIYTLSVNNWFFQLVPNPLHVDMATKLIRQAIPRILSQQGMPPYADPVDPQKFSSVSFVVAAPSLLLLFSFCQTLSLSLVLVKYFEIIKTPMDFFTLRVSFFLLSFFLPVCFLI
jgi:hypothetical protein